MMGRLRVVQTCDQFTCVLVVSVVLAVSSHHGAVVCSLSSHYLPPLGGSPSWWM